MNLYDNMMTIDIRVAFHHQSYQRQQIIEAAIKPYNRMPKTQDTKKKNG